MAGKEDREPAGIPSSKRHRFCNLFSSSESEDEGETPRVHSTVASRQSATLNDLSLFDCPICFEPLLSTVFQCENGHIACPTCCLRMENKCPNCRSSPIGNIRCRGLEKVLGSVTVICRNKLYGCTETFKLDEKLFHDEICRFKPCTCPHENCSYVGMPTSLFGHFGEAHNPSPFTFNVTKSITLDAIRTQVFLQDSSQRTLFVLKFVIKSRARFLSVASIGPDSMRRAFSYDLTADIDGETGVKIKSGVVCVRKWTAESVLGKCLVLPRDLVDEWGKLKVKLVIKRNPTRG